MLANVLETRATSGFSYPVQVNNLLSPSPTRPATDIEKRGIKKREQGEEEGEGEREEEEEEGKKKEKETEKNKKKIRKKNKKKRKKKNTRKRKRGAKAIRNVI